MCYDQIQIEETPFELDNKNVWFLLQFVRKSINSMIKVYLTFQVLDNNKCVNVSAEQRNITKKLKPKQHEPASFLSAGGAHWCPCVVI